jgi:beta-lactamase superfamily II metal-dependent hydrolase
MKFTIFQSDKGDCLLLESDDLKRILVDGGMADAYIEHVAPAMGRLRQQNIALDLVYVSHIDEDHIAGVLQLMEDEAAWRVFEHQKATGNPLAKQPTQLRPAKVREIWHNAFHEQLGKNSGEIGDMLAASSRLLAASPAGDLRALAEEHQELALSQMEAMRLSRRIGQGQLNIPLNPRFNGKLMYVRTDSEPFQMGKLKIFVIGPFEKDLRKLRTDWNAWLRVAKNQESVEELQRKSKEDEKDLGNGVARLLRQMELQAQVFGDRIKVTPPNLASLMLYVEEPRPAGVVRRYLLTGDGPWQDIVKGLRHHGKFNQAPEGLHVDVLKGQHHGSEHNWHPDFCRAVTADHYIFCGNGKHENPDLGVLQMVIDSRVGPADRRSRNTETGNPFTLWFNSSSSVKGDDDAQKHMKKVEQLVAAAGQNPKVRSRFLNQSSFGFTI